MDSREILKISLVSLIFGVGLSFLYPSGAAWELPWPVPFHFLVEIFYYTLIISLFDNSTELAVHLFYAGGSFLFRIITSLVFAAAIATESDTTLPTAFRLGMIGYIPQLYSVTLVSPWILLSFIKNSYRLATPITVGDAKGRDLDVAGEYEKIMPSSSPAWLESNAGFVHSDSTENALDYIMDFSGVIGCLLTNNEGLLIESRWHSKEGADLWAANTADLFRANLLVLERCGDRTVHNLEIKTGQRKIGIYSLSGLLLTVVSKHSADELLKIRIIRAIEMLRNVGHSKPPKGTKVKV